MVAEKRRLVWDRQAIEGLKVAFGYVREDSPKSAQRLIKEIKDPLEQVRLHPQIFQADRFMLNNTGQYRAFEIWSYRVTYRYRDELVMVLRVRHGRRNPIHY